MRNAPERQSDVGTLPCEREREVESFKLRFLPSTNNGLHRRNQRTHQRTHPRHRSQLARKVSVARIHVRLTFSAATGDSHQQPRRFLVLAVSLEYAWVIPPPGCLPGIRISDDPKFLGAVR